MSNIIIHGPIISRSGLTTRNFTHKTQGIDKTPFSHLAVQKPMMPDAVKREEKHVITTIFEIETPQLKQKKNVILDTDNIDIKFRPYEHLQLRN